MIIEIREGPEGAIHKFTVSNSTSISEVLQMLKFNNPEFEIWGAYLQSHTTPPIQLNPYDTFADKGFPDDSSYIFFLKRIRIPAATLERMFSTQAQDPESQRLRMLDQQRAALFNEFPEMFLHPFMLHLPVRLNGTPLVILVDTGAHHSTATLATIERCGLREFLDTRVTGLAVGVGSARIVGQIYAAAMEVNGHEYRVGITVIDNRPPQGAPSHSVDFLLGLDMLRRYGCVIDLRKLSMRFGDGNEVNFLDREDAERRLTDT